MSKLTESVFRTLFTDSEWEAHQGRQQNLKEDQERFAALPDAALAEEAQRYFKNCERCRFLPGEPVYDGVMQHVIIPEMIKRLRD